MLAEPMVVASTADSPPQPIGAADMIADARAMLCDFKTTLPSAAQSTFTYALSPEPSETADKGATKSQEDRIREFAANAPREAIVETLLQFHKLSKLLLKPVAKDRPTSFATALSNMMGNEKPEKPAVRLETHYVDVDNDIIADVATMAAYEDLPFEMEDDMRKEEGGDGRELAVARPLENPGAQNVVMGTRELNLLTLTIVEELVNAGKAPSCFSVMDPAATHIVPLNRMKGGGRQREFKSNAPLALLNDRVMQHERGQLFFQVCYKKHFILVEFSLFHHTIFVYDSAPDYMHLLRAEMLHTLQSWVQGQCSKFYASVAVRSSSMPPVVTVPVLMQRLGSNDSGLHVLNNLAARLINVDLRTDSIPHYITRAKLRSWFQSRMDGNPDFLLDPVQDQQRRPDAPYP